MPTQPVSSDALDGPLLDRIDLRRLRHFVTVAEECHFGRAAARLTVAQPALSQQVKSLESDLGAQLFHRTTRRVELTPAARVLLPRALALLAEAQEMAQEVRRVAEGAEGLLRLGFIGSATYEVMPTLARGLQAEVPGLTLELTGELLSQSVVRGLAEGRLDVGFLRPFAPVADVSSRRLRGERLVVALPVDHRLAERDEVELVALAEESWVGYPQHGSLIHDVALEAMRAAGFTPRRIVEVRETATLVSFVAAGMGVALVPEGVANVHLPGVAYLPLGGAPRTVDLVLAWRDDVPSAILRRVFSHLPS